MIVYVEKSQGPENLVARAYNPNTQEVQVGRLLMSSWPGWAISKTLSHKVCFFKGCWRDGLGIKSTVCFWKTSFNSQHLYGCPHCLKLQSHGIQTFFWSL